MKYQIADTYKSRKDEFIDIVSNFNAYSDFVNEGQRNSIKKVVIDGLLLNIKAFKIPNIFNQLAYKYMRKSKAERSYIYAHKLLSLGIKTPEPIAFFEFSKGFGFGKSFYISQQLECDLTFRDLCINLKYLNHEQILREFTKFTFNLHEKGVHFMDHSQGNTLIIQADSYYNFYLVDLNRMKFEFMDFNSRMKNFSRLSKQEEIISIMADEYSKLYGKTLEDVKAKMWFYVNKFQNKRGRKKQLKKKLLFWN